MKPETTAILEKLWPKFNFLFAGGAQPASWRQEPYRSDLFRAFAEIYQIERVGGDNLQAFYQARCLTEGVEQREKKLKVLWEICEAWNEWRYAWDHHEST